MLAKRKLVMNITKMANSHKFLVSSYIGAIFSVNCCGMDPGNPGGEFCLR